MPGITVCHYTTEKGAKSIRKAKKIKASDPGNKDAFFGRGVYFTSMDPINNTKKEIAENNWDNNKGAWYVSLGKVDWVIIVNFPSNDRPDKKKDPNGRDVFVYPDDVNLNDYDHEITKVE